MMPRLDPAALDLSLLRSLAEKYATPDMLAALRAPDVVLDAATPDAPIEPRDDFEACAIERAEDFKALFAGPFYFGCEAEDRMSAWAFDTRCNPFGARLQPMFGSDIGHFDVSDMSRVLCEAHELVEEQVTQPADFRSFVFENAVRLFGETNPDFFRGTAVEAEAGLLLAARG
jgi:hypothetical protein